MGTAQGEGQDQGGKHDGQRPLIRKSAFQNEFHEWWRQRGRRKSELHQWNHKRGCLQVQKRGQGGREDGNQ